MGRPPTRPCGIGRRGRAPHPADVSADRGVRVPALHQPGAVAPRFRCPPARPGRGRRRPPAGAGQVPRHLLRTARRVLPNTGRRARGSGGGGRADPLGRRPTSRRAADDDPGPGRGAGPAPGSHLLGPHRAGPGRRRHPLRQLVLARQRGPPASRRGLPAPDLSRADPAGRRPRPPLPLHLEPLAQPGGRGAGPLLGRGPHRPGQGAPGPAPFRGHARRRALRARSSRSSPPTWTRCSPA